MDVIKLLGVRREPLSTDEVLAAIADPGAGGTCVFIGTVRDIDDTRHVERLEYEAHPLVENELRKVAEGVATEIPLLGLAAIHRVGELEIGDAAVVVAAAAAHRDEAFAACRKLIDDLKSGVPIWKRQAFTDGSSEWVGSP